MPEGYTPEWNELRRLHKRVLTAVLEMVGIFLVMGLIAIFNAPIWLGWVTFAIWVATIINLARVAVDYFGFPCPRCGDFFFLRRNQREFWRASFGGSCIHCRLPKWVDPDPDPWRRQELDPFRSNVIFKLDESHRR